MSLTLVLYGASWCGPTQSLRSRLDEKPLAIPYNYVDVDEKPLPALKLGLKGVPALALFGGEGAKSVVRGVLMGDAPVDIIEEWIEEISRGVT